MRTAASLCARVFAEQRKHIFQCVKPLYDEPLAIAEGSECWVRDYDGREHLDAFAGILTTSPGHCHPAVVSAVQEQAARVGHLSTLYVNDRQIWTIPGGGSSVSPRQDMCAEVLAQCLHCLGQAPQFTPDLPQSLAKARLTLAEARLTLAEMDDLAA